MRNNWFAKYGIVACLAAAALAVAFYWANAPNLPASGEVAKPPSVAPKANGTATADANEHHAQKEYPMSKVVKTDEEWRAMLTPMQYKVTRQKGTERAGSGEYAYTKEKGTYVCVCCGLPLFSSETKFDSGTGWPSYYAPIDERHVTELDDRSWWQVRTEVLCSRCDSHLGHVFPDGPPDKTGLRYCMNSAALKFEPSGQSHAQK